MAVTARSLWIIFISSIWIFIGLCAYKIVLHILYASQIIGAYPGGYDFKVFVAPFFLIVMEIFLWFKMFRYCKHPARIFAGVVGLYIWLMVVLVNVIVTDLYDYEVNNYVLLLYAYAGFGHVAYALFGKERVY